MIGPMEAVSSIQILGFKVGSNVHVARFEQAQGLGC